MLAAVLEEDLQHFDQVRLGFFDRPAVRFGQDFDAAGDVVVAKVRNRAGHADLRLPRCSPRL